MALSLFFVHLSIAGGVVDISLGFGGRVVGDIASSIMHIRLSSRGSIISNITCSIVNIGLSDRVDKSRVNGVSVDNGGVSVGNVGGGVWQGIPSGTKSSIGEAVDKRSNSSLVSWAGKSHRGEGEQSEALHDDCQ